MTCLLDNCRSLWISPEVSAQRRAFKTITTGASGTSAMTLERATKLNKLGFEWEAVNPNNVPWETRYGELLEFVVSSNLLSSLFPLYFTTKLCQRWQCCEMHYLCLPLLAMSKRNGSTRRTMSFFPQCNSHQRQIVVEAAISCDTAK